LDLYRAAHIFANSLQVPNTVQLGVTGQLIPIARRYFDLALQGRGLSSILEDDSELYVPTDLNISRGIRSWRKYFYWSDPGSLVDTKVLMRVPPKQSGYDGIPYSGQYSYSLQPIFLQKYTSDLSPDVSSKVPPWWGSISAALGLVGIC